MKYTKDDLYVGMKFKILSVWTIVSISPNRTMCVLSSGDNSSKDYKISTLLSSLNRGTFEVIDYQKPTSDFYSIY